MPRSRFNLLCGLLFILALALRLFYAFDAKTENPIVGDVNYYVLYAWNLEQAQTFSSSLPNQDRKVPDSFRGPGYPVLLATAMAAAGDTKIMLGDGTNGRSRLIADPPTWMTYAYILQSVLGALSVLIVIAIARFWLDERVSLVVGLGTALWPHLIVFSGTLLSETLLCFLLSLTLWLTLCANRERRLLPAGAAGIGFGLTYLVNPVVALLPLFIAAGFALQRQMRLTLIFAAAYLLLPLGWAARNASIETDFRGASSRLAENFVEGSWPQFLTALNSRFANEMSAEIVAAENVEENAFESDPVSGFQLIRERMALDPLYYASWYLFEKPYLLWDWKIRVGWGDIYFLATPISPFEQIAILKVIKNVFAALNPVFFGLALFAVFLAAIRLFKQGLNQSFPLLTIVLTTFYVTAVHVILQAEPRYSIPYRPEELLLAATTIAWIVDRMTHVLAMRRSRATTEVQEANTNL